MKPWTKSEWFTLESPIGEPNIIWDGLDLYGIERLVKHTGEIIWFGQAVNWKKEPDGEWTVLSTDENVKVNSDGTYPEGRSVFMPCEIPLYEKLYLELKQQNLL